jgi:hypothetical protein
MKIALKLFINKAELGSCSYKQNFHPHEFWYDIWKLIVMGDCPGHQEVSVPAPWPAVPLTMPPRRWNAFLEYLVHLSNFRVSQEKKMAASYSWELCCSRAVRTHVQTRVLRLDNSANVFSAVKYTATVVKWDISCVFCLNKKPKC